MRSPIRGPRASLPVPRALCGGRLPCDGRGRSPCGQPPENLGNLKAPITKGSTWGLAPSETCLGYVELVGEQSRGKGAGAGASSVPGWRSRDMARRSRDTVIPLYSALRGWLGGKRDNRPELEVERSRLDWSCASRLCHLFAGPGRTKL